LSSENPGTPFGIILAGGVKKTAWNFQDSTEKLLAYAYVWAKASDPDLYGEWDGILR
jgi:hypothetical protein